MSIRLAASFTILTGNLSGAVAFFGFKCLSILWISMTVAGFMVKSLSSEKKTLTFELILTGAVPVVVCTILI